MRDIHSHSSASSETTRPKIENSENSYLIFILISISLQFVTFKMVYEVILQNLSNEEENLSMISEVKFEFRYIEGRSSLESQKFTVPRIDASW